MCPLQIGLHGTTPLVSHISNYLVDYIYNYPLATNLSDNDDNNEEEESEQKNIN
jgi:hypothetical protein